MIADSARAPRVVIINATLARRFVPGYPRHSVLGLRVPMIPMNSTGTDRVPFTIVGVVADFRGSRLDATEIMVGAVSDTTALVGAIRALLKPQTLAERLNASIAPGGFEMTLLIVFASLALLLPVVGLYGVVAFIVTQRTAKSECGWRWAHSGAT